MRTKSLFVLTKSFSLAFLSMASTLAACGGDTGSGGSGGSGGGGAGTSSSTSSATQSTTSTSTGTSCDKQPGSGMTQVVPPDGSGTVVGIGAAMAIMKNGAPLIAYGSHPPAGGDSVLVTRWDPCAGAWTAPMVLDQSPTGELGGIRPIGVAVDPSDGRVAITYEKDHLIQMPNPTHQIFVAVSTDEGATFSKEPVSHHCVEDAGCTHLGDEDNALNPHLALAGGKTFVVYAQHGAGCGPSGCRDAVVLATKDMKGSAWSREVIKDALDPLYGDALYADVTFPPSVAVDAAGAPGVLAFQHPDQSSSPISYNWALYFARPGSTAIQVLDSNEVQNDVGTGSSSLLFEGTKVRALAHLHDQPAGTETRDLLFATSDDGKSFSAPVALPRDGDEVTASSQALLADGKGGFIVVAQAGGGSTNTFGEPKILRSPDGAAWSLGGAGAAADKLSPSSVTAARDASGKLCITFQGSSPAVTTLGGVVFWREP